MKLSVCIPTYSMRSGDYFFKRCLDSLWNQTFQDFEIVVTDNSDDGVIESICEYYKTGIRYFRNRNKGMAQNTNEAIQRSKGDLIKILYMDDYLYVDKSLEFIVNNFEGQWLVTSCRHTITGDETFNTHHPRYSQDIHTGNNTIGSPSVLTIKNEQPLLFDEKLGYMLDCDYYRRMYEIYGEPTIMKHVNVIIGLHDGQVSSLISKEAKLQEQGYLLQKYDTI